MISENDSPWANPIPLPTEFEMDQSDMKKMVSHISKLAREREEKWLSDCMAKIMPASISDKVHTNPARVQKWLSRRGIWVDRTDPSGDIKLMFKDKVASILKAPQLPGIEKPA